MNGRSHALLIPLCVLIAGDVLAEEPVSIRAQERQENTDSEHDRVRKAGGTSCEMAAAQAPIILPDDTPDPLTLISEALDKRVRFDFRDVALKDALARFEASLKIDIRIDQQAFLVDGITDESTVTVRSSGATFRSALRAILNPLQLTWIIEDESLLVTTIERASLTLRAKTYNVTDLVGLDVGVEKKPRPFSMFGMLMNAIVDNTGAPHKGEWERNGGEGTISPVRIGNSNLLVIRQTQAVHAEIDELLSNLRNALE